jgi:hypothetical protein
VGQHQHQYPGEEGVRGLQNGLVAREEQAPRAGAVDALRASRGGEPTGRRVGTVAVAVARGGQGQGQGQGQGVAEEVVQTVGREHAVRGGVHRGLGPAREGGRGGQQPGDPGPRCVGRLRGHLCVYRSLRWCEGGWRVVGC